MHYDFVKRWQEIWISALDGWLHIFGSYLQWTGSGTLEMMHEKGSVQKQDSFIWALLQYETHILAWNTKIKTIIYLEKAYTILIKKMVLATNYLSLKWWTILGGKGGKIHLFLNVGDY